jgi:hypothetical protein
MSLRLAYISGFVYLVFLIAGLCCIDYRKFSSSLTRKDYNFPMVVSFIMLCGLGFRHASDVPNTYSIVTAFIAVPVVLAFFMASITNRLWFITGKGFWNL